MTEPRAEIKNSMGDQWRLFRYEIL